MKTLSKKECKKLVAFYIMLNESEQKIEIADEDENLKQVIHYINKNLDKNIRLEYNKYVYIKICRNTNIFLAKEHIMIKLLKLLGKYKPNGIVGPPTLYEALLKNKNLFCVFKR